MSETTKRALHVLAAEAVGRMAATGRPLVEFAGIALYSTRRDELITSLESFEPATRALADLPLLQERYGGGAARRLALQFVYELLPRLTQPSFDEAAFEATWEAFVEELAEPEWTFRGVANLRNIESDMRLIELADNVAIRGRHLEELAGLGFSPWVLDRLIEDVSGVGASSFVIVAAHRLTKVPENLVLMDSSTAWLKAQRALGALRLLSPGDVSMGRMWMARPARFNVGLGGVTIVGFAVDAIGSRYVLTDEVIQAHARMYGALQHLEQHGYGRAPGNLNLALRSFMATYDRWPSTDDSKLVDAVTALEAVLGTGTEIAFRLAFRVAGILGNTDADRVAAFEDIKAFYDVRSRVVHGGALSEKQRRKLAEVDRLREHVRRLLRALVRLATTEGHPYDKRFFGESWDAALLDSGQRDRLRHTMGLA